MYFGFVLFAWACVRSKHGLKRPEHEACLESQVALNTRPLYPKVAHKRAKVTQNYRLLALHVRPGLACRATSAAPLYLARFTGISPGKGTLIVGLIGAPSLGLWGLLGAY